MLQKTIINLSPGSKTRRNVFISDEAWKIYKKVAKEMGISISYLITLSATSIEEQWESFKNLKEEEKAQLKYNVPVK